ncbi:class I SAM-dependent methyltransferase [Microbacterium sp.]|uniref:class I SAM-dependent methyltransferase n=1 Tax=Microbacterium sp. TaxID=51671 RepID=UPI0027360A3E|nr:class I SAM-dependent methyltransferase [Microbacterium sp.]MDP3952640.1 class I SAM-dependent methyltransferase [Microbacterium sp.]
MGAEFQADLASLMFEANLHGMTALASRTRETTVVNALRIVAHTHQLDPDFMEKCIQIALHDRSNAGRMLEQDEDEFAQMLGLVKGYRSALEIGSRYGKSIERIAQQMPAGSRVVAVDLPYSDVIEDMPAPEPVLRETIAAIGLKYDAHLLIGDSHHPEVVAAAQALGPYDFCFIDGDHSYEGVSADWENYGPQAKVVAFHDIVNNPACMKFWSEIKKSYRTVEYTSSAWLGIGIVFR